MSNLSSLLDRYKALVIFDTETSGLNPGDNQIIELAALRVERTQTGALRIAGKMDTFIKLPEGEKLPENIVTLTGITDRLLEAEGVQRALLTLVENLQRQDMNCFETAEGMHRLIDTYGLTQEEAANRLGCSQPTIANKLRLLRLPPEERSAIIGAGLTERHSCVLRTRSSAGWLWAGLSRAA